MENIHEWIRPVAFEAWFLWFRQATAEASESRPSSTMSNYAASSLAVSRFVFYKYLSFSDVIWTQNSPPSRMSETEDFMSDINHKTLSESIGIPPSSRAASSVPSIIFGNFENPIIISDSDVDEDLSFPSAQDLAERRRLNHSVKEEPKDNVLPVKRRHLYYLPSLVSIFIISVL